MTKKQWIKGRDSIIHYIQRRPSRKDKGENGRIKNIVRKQHIDSTHGQNNKFTEHQTKRASYNNTAKLASKLYLNCNRSLLSRKLRTSSGGWHGRNHRRCRYILSIDRCRCHNHRCWSIDNRRWRHNHWRRGHSTGRWRSGPREKERIARHSNISLLLFDQTAIARVSRTIHFTNFHIFSRHKHGILARAILTALDLIHCQFNGLRLHSLRW